MTQERMEPISPEVAAELRMMVRKNRIDAVSPPDPRREFLIALTAAGAHVDRGEWARFIGNWSEELAFGVTDRALAADLLDDLYLVCAIAPELRRMLTPSIAAASGFVRMP